MVALTLSLTLSIKSAVVIYPPLVYEYLELTKRENGVLKEEHTNLISVGFNCGLEGEDSVEEGSHDSWSRSLSGFQGAGGRKGEGGEEEKVGELHFRKIGSWLLRG